MTSKCYAVLAGYSVAMGNGNAAVKEIADFITLTNDEDGVAHAIHKLIETEKENDHEIPNLLDRFITYVKVNTRSDENSTTTPSTQSQVDFATNVLIPEMKRVGLQKTSTICQTAMLLEHFQLMIQALHARLDLSLTWIPLTSMPKMSIHKSLRIMMGVSLPW